MLYDILTVVGNLIPNPVYLHEIWKQNVLGESYFQTRQNLFVCTELNDFKYCYPTQIILFIYSYSVSSIAV